MWMPNVNWPLHFGVKLIQVCEMISCPITFEMVHSWWDEIFQEWTWHRRLTRESWIACCNHLVTIYSATRGAYCPNPLHLRGQESGGSGTTGAIVVSSGLGQQVVNGPSPHGDTNFATRSYRITPNNKPRNSQAFYVVSLLLIIYLACHVCAYP